MRIRVDLPAPLGPVEAITLTGVEGDVDVVEQGRGAVGFTEVTKIDHSSLRPPSGASELSGAEPKPHWFCAMLA